jgi:NADH-quinone oxidoreductase subunit L
MARFFSMPDLIWWVVALPLLGATINGAIALVGPRFRWQVAQSTVAMIGVGAPVLAFLIAARYFFILSGFDAGDFSPYIEPLFTWVAFDRWVVDVGLRTDELSMIMTLVVTGVGSLIHLYSVGYMAHDKGFTRYFAYLNLFLFFMLLLVLGDSLPLMFVGWEGVGLCSYLLIGFWFDDAEKAYAGKKAFIVNRIGDFGFLIGIFFIIYALRQVEVPPGTALLNFQVIQDLALRGGSPLLPFATVIALCLFVGACGKSAQIPLYVWLPDAMAGPTPVSALIHAATMVTAGVYMVARMHFLFTLSPTAMAVVATVGAVTAFFAATMALVQDDIKKVLAYSTVSQLGYMFLACGLGAFSAAIFHVVMHAFFKALLFLGSGSIIHAMDNEQRMSCYGGLRKELPITFWTFLVATLAIAGIYPFAGFFSKDAILWAALHPTFPVAGHFWLWLLGLLTACLTAFYMFRLLGLTFFGKRREAGKHIHCHREESITMLIPLVVLGVLSVMGGWIGVPAAFGGVDHFHHFLQAIFFQGAHAQNHQAEMLTGFGTMLGMGVIAVIALALYAQPNLAWAERMATRFGRTYRMLTRLYWMDEIYDWVIIRPLRWFSHAMLWRLQDAFLIDRVFVHGTGKIMLLVGRLSTVLQTGVVSQYLFAFVLGAVFVLWYLVV